MLKCILENILSAPNRCLQAPNYFRPLKLYTVLGDMGVDGYFHIGFFWCLQVSQKEEIHIIDAEIQLVKRFTGVGAEYRDILYSHWDCGLHSKVTE